MKARLPQGAAGGPGNINQMLKQAQKMQEDMAALQAELETREYEVSAGGGAVTVVISGSRRLKSVRLQPEIVDPDDVQMLEDLIVAAVNEAISRVEHTQQEEMKKLSGGLDIPGLF